MRRVTSVQAPQAAAGGKSPSDDEELGVRGRRGRDNEDLGGVGMGVMVCGGSAVFEDEEEAGSPVPSLPPPAASPARRRVNVGGQYSNLPTLPARRALLSGENQFVDNTASVGAATTLIGSNFGVNFGGDKAMSLPSHAATATVEADILSNHKAIESPGHLAVLNKLAGLTVDAAADKTQDTRGRNTWRSPYRLPKAPGSSDRAVLAPASLNSVASPHKSTAGSAPAPGMSGAKVQDDTDDDGDASHPMSESFCSSSGSDSEDGSGSEGDAAAGVFGASHRRASGGGEEVPGAADRKDFCLGIRWFIRNNKLVVGSFSGWSVADKMGVKHGDILRAVDGVEVLNMVADKDGDHPAKNLLRGIYGSKCALHLMRVDVSQVKDMLNRPGAQAGKEKLILHDVHVDIPRLIAADI
jgi:hypothetical protein